MDTIFSRRAIYTRNFYSTPIQIFIYSELPMIYIYMVALSKLARVALLSKSLFQQEERKAGNSPRIKIE